MKATQSHSNTSVDVAGVVTHGDGRVLLAERPQGGPSAGYREFPGGKFASNASPRVAPGRELHEEPGVEADAAYPWITRIHRYPHAGPEPACCRAIKAARIFIRMRTRHVPPATLLK